MYCINCGLEVNSIAKFCNQCGTRQILEKNDPIKLTPSVQVAKGAANQSKASPDNGVGFKFGYWFGALNTRNKTIIVVSLLVFILSIFIELGSQKKSTSSNVNLTNTSTESGSIIISAISQKLEGGYCMIAYEIENLTSENFTRLRFESIAKDENGNILQKYPYTLFEQVLPKSKVKSKNGGAFSNLPCQRIELLELTIDGVEIDGNSLYGNPKRVAAFGKIVKGSPNGEISVSAQGGQIAKVANTNAEPKGNLLEKAISPFYGNKILWDKFKDAGGLDSESSFYGLSVKNINSEFENDEKIKIAILLLKSGAAPLDVRKSLSKACRLKEEDWKFESGPPQRGEATKIGVTCGYIEGRGQIEVFMQRNKN